MCLTKAQNLYISYTIIGMVDKIILSAPFHLFTTGGVFQANKTLMCGAKKSHNNSLIILLLELQPTIISVEDEGRSARIRWA